MVVRKNNIQEEAMAKTKSVATAPATTPRSTTTRSAAKPAPARKAGPAKSAPVKAAPAKAAPAKPAAKPRSRAAASKARTIPPEQKRNYIEVAAYYIAARRDFAPGDPLQDWIQAEAEIDALLAKGLLGA